MNNKIVTGTTNRTVVTDGTEPEQERAAWLEAQIRKTTVIFLCKNERGEWRQLEMELA